MIKTANKLILINAALALFYYCAATIAYAGGTAPGTVLEYSATATYSITSNGQTQTGSLSTSTTITVAELIDVSTTWQDASNVSVSPGQTNAITTFKVTNSGNGTETFKLSVNAAVAGDNFDPSFVSVYLDINGNSVYDAGIDVLYIAGKNDPILAADGYVTVFVFCNIPSSGLSDGNLGFVELTATSKTGTGKAGHVIEKMGETGVDAVIGSSGGASVATGIYQASVATVVLSKTAGVSDPTGGSQPMTGAVIHYSIAVTVTGSGTAVGVVVTDPIPGYTTYSAGTLKLNESILTDAKDNDAGDAGGTTAGTVTVSLGNLTSASPAETITFDVTIN